MLLLILYLLVGYNLYAAFVSNGIVMSKGFSRFIRLNQDIMPSYSKQDVPSANYEMHAIHCKRFLTTCPQCGESVNKNQIQEHIDENHAEVSVFFSVCLSVQYAVFDCTFWFRSFLILSLSFLGQM